MVIMAVLLCLVDKRYRSDKLQFIGKVPWLTGRRSLHGLEHGQDYVDQTKTVFTTLNNTTGWLMQQLDSIIRDLFDNSSKIPASKVPFQSEARTLCEQNLCGNYGRSWTCPPAVGSLEKLQSRFSTLSQVTIFNKVYVLEDSFDWDGMKSAARDFQSRVLQLKQKIRKIDPEFVHIALGAGACAICDTCTCEKQLACRNPMDAIISVEACGIDVMAMLNETGIAYNNGSNTVSYVGAVFFD